VKSILAVTAVVLCILSPNLLAAQASAGALSEAEVESLRAASYIPIDRIRTYEKILDTRARRIEDLVKSRPRPGRSLDLHDAIDQFAGIVDELNDNLDEYDRQHRDIRKALARLLTATGRWSATLKAPADDEEYNAVRKIALHNTEDTHALAQELTASLDTYFKEHPEAAAAEKKRAESPHAPTADGPQR
jgi:ABC-type transporter Mla subunit MlaD